MQRLGGAVPTGRHLFTPSSFDSGSGHGFVDATRSNGFFNSAWTPTSGHEPLNFDGSQGTNSPLSAGHHSPLLGAPASHDPIGMPSRKTFRSENDLRGSPNTKFNAEAEAAENAYVDTDHSPLHGRRLRPMHDAECNSRDPSISMCFARGVRVQSHDTARSDSLPTGGESPLLGGRNVPRRAPSAQTVVSTAVPLYDQTQSTAVEDMFMQKIYTDYVEVRHLGSGNFGSVTLCRDRNSDELVAIKSVGPVASYHEYKQLVKERTLLTYVRGHSRHLLTLLTSWVEGVKPGMKVEDPIRTHVSGYLVTPYCPHGNVAGVIAYRRERGIVWTDAEVLAFIGEMAEALFTLHTNKIAHVDFKPENVLIDTDLSYVLSDFGLAQFIDPTTGRPAGGKVTGPIIRRSGHQPAFGSQSQATQSQREVSMSRSNRPSQQLVSAHASVSRLRPTAAQLFASCDSQSQNHSFGWQGSGSIANLGASSGHVHPVASVFQHGGGGGYGERSVSVAYSVNTCASQDEGDCRYVSPDMLNRKDHYMAGDLFALGISIFEMLAGEPAPKNGPLHVDLRSGNPVAVLSRCPALTSRGYRRLARRPPSPQSPPSFIRRRCSRPRRSTQQPQRRFPGPTIAIKGLTAALLRCRQRCSMPRPMATTGPPARLWISRHHRLISAVVRATPPRPSRASSINLNSCQRPTAIRCTPPAPRRLPASLRHGSGTTRAQTSCTPCSPAQASRSTAWRRCN
jgi:serine/threonine protein kinase